MGSKLSWFDYCPSATFIETGTGAGATLRAAARHFRRCCSIERSPALYQEAVSLFQDRPVELYLGDSRAVLPRVIVASEPTVFWLDAHFTGDYTHFQLGWDECPLADELVAIRQVPWHFSPVILIDDAFMFDRSLPVPPGFDLARFNLDAWPTVQRLDEELAGFQRRLVGDDVVGGDVLEYRFKP